ncbi:unnamed protein product [Adineta steineri]|nr:unnamed protein product [Adineta steineri]CAF3893017.1 unnamed protein product [Adineta steineri]CAF4019739.1 unnamed protein product [Adineta steineri]
MHADLNLFLTSIGNKQNLSTNSSIDSLTALEEILRRQQTRNSTTFQPQKPLLASPSAINSPISIPLATTTTNSAIIPISFPEPPHHTHSTSNYSKRPRTSTTSAKQTTTAPKKLFSYTLYDRKYFFQHYHHTSVEQLFKILLEYADVEISVSSSIEPLFEKLGQTVLASAQIKRFDVKILPNEPTNESQSLINHPPQSPPSVVQFGLPHIRPSILDTSNELAIFSVTNLSTQSVCRQSLEYDQLHSAYVQAGIRVQRVQQEVNLSFTRLVYQFYTVVGNALEYTGVDEITKANTNEQQILLFLHLKTVFQLLF